MFISFETYDQVSGLIRSLYFCCSYWSLPSPWLCFSFYFCSPVLYTHFTHQSPNIPSVFVTVFPFLLLFVISKVLYLGASFPSALYHWWPYCSHSLNYQCQLCIFLSLFSLTSNFLTLFWIHCQLLSSVATDSTISLFLRLATSKVILNSYFPKQGRCQVLLVASPQHLKSKF